MKKYIANIQIDNGIEKQETESRDLSEAEEYFYNFVRYWSKVWFGWRGAYVIDIQEKSEE
jgi:hypothetical protein